MSANDYRFVSRLRKAGMAVVAMVVAGATPLPAAAGPGSAVLEDAPSPFAPAIEFYHRGLDHYFVTHIVDEIAILDAGVQLKGWTRTGQSFPVWVGAWEDTSPVCRYYIPPAMGDSHFYGRGYLECDNTGARHPEFIDESSEFFFVRLPTVGDCPSDMQNVYRVFNNRPDANHRYTTDKAVRDQMVAQGWLAEGDGPDLVVMCVPK